jgi:hypothetical protein
MQNQNDKIVPKSYSYDVARHYDVLHEIFLQQTKLYNAVKIFQSLLTIYVRNALVSGLYQHRNRSERFEFSYLFI